MAWWKDNAGKFFKWCGRCRKWLEVEENFNRDKSRGDGREGYCKWCKEAVRK